MQSIGKERHDVGRPNDVGYPIRGIIKGDIFDKYKYAFKKQRNFYKRYTSGEDIKAGWVNPSDFRK